MVRRATIVGILAVPISVAFAACDDVRPLTSAHHAPQASACAYTIPIYASQLSEWASIIAMISPEAKRNLVPPYAAALSFRAQARAFLVASAKTVAEAREIGFHPSEADLKSTLINSEYELSTLETAPRGPLQVLEISAVSPRARLLAIELQLSERAIETWARSRAERGVPPTRVAAYYRAHTNAFVVPERRDVAVIETFGKAKIEQAKREIDAGSSFLTVMRRQDDEPDVGGLKRNMVESRLRHPYEKDYFAAKPHTLVGPRKSELYYMFEVRSVVRPMQRSLVQAGPSIRSILVRGASTEKVKRALEDRLPAKSACPSP